MHDIRIGITVPVLYFYQVSTFIEIFTNLVKHYYKQIVTKQ
jgi:hypothetical protein